MRIELKILNKEFYCNENVPAYQTPGSAAMDLRCTKDYTIYPGETVAIYTGLAIHIGSGIDYFLRTENVSIAGLVLPRSGMGAIKDLVLGNLVGVLDEDYRSEIIVYAWHKASVSNIPINLKSGDRFAQLMLIPVIKAEWSIVEEFSDPIITRGSFGSTGLD